MISFRFNTKSWYFKLSLYIIGLIPAFWYFYLGSQGQLGADPIRTFEDNLGFWAIRFLIASLCITPLRKLARVNLVRYRRTVGLLAFYYAFIHLTVYIVLDKQLALDAIVHEITTKPYLIIGTCAFLMLSALAITSNSWGIRTLGKKWVQLHKLVYPATLLVGVHFMLAVKSWPTNMLVYNAIFIALVAYRVVIAFMDFFKRTKKATHSNRQKPA